MKTIILISDTHEITDAANRIKNSYPRADYLVHCGDSLLPENKLDGYIAVKGNVDRNSNLSEERIIEIEGFHILIIHGNSLFAGYDPDYKAVARKARAKHCNAVFFGHSHTYYDGIVDGIRLLNPGSIWKNRDESPASYMEVLIDENMILAKRHQYLDVLIGNV